MNTNTQPMMITKLIEEELQNDSDKLIIPRILGKISKSPEIKNKTKNKIRIDFANPNKLQTSMMNLNKSNISVQKIKFNKKNYDQYMFQKKYLLSKTQYHKLISNLSEIEEKLKENKENIEKLNKSLNELKEEKKKKKEKVIDLLSSKESLEEIYKNKISSFENNDQKFINEKNDNINGQIINVETVNDNGEEHTNPNTNDSNNSNDDNKINENDNECHKKKVSSSSSISSDNNILIEIKFNEIKISDPKKYEEQVNSFAQAFLQKKDSELSMKLIKKVNLSYQYFNTEINTPENDNQNSISNFFSRISLFIANQNLGNISEKLVNSYLRELMKINSIGEEISEILLYLNKKYKDNKKELKEKIKILKEKNENLITKKKSYLVKKEELRQFMEENKDKYNNEKNKVSIGNDKIVNASFISEGNNIKTKRILRSNRSGMINGNKLNIKKINISSINNNTKNKVVNLNNNENIDLNISKDMNANTERLIIDNLNKYLINSFKINKSKRKVNSMEIVNKKAAVLHKNSFSKSGVNINNLLINNTDKNDDSTNKNNVSNANLANNSEIIFNNKSYMNNKRISTKIIFRNTKLKKTENKSNNLIFNNNTSNLKDLISAKKNPSKSKIIFLKELKSNSFRNIKKLQSPPKITKTQRHNHIYFQREELKAIPFSRSPDSHNYRYNNKTSYLKYQGKVIPIVNKGNQNMDKRIDISRVDKNNIYSTRYDNRLKLLTKGIKESFCYFKFYGENHVEYNPLDELLKTPENLDYVEGYISIDVFWHKFKVIPKIYKNKKINITDLANNLSKEINISELKSEIDNEYCDDSCLGIELKDIIDITLSKGMKDIIKIYSGYLKYSERHDKPDINQFIINREIREIIMDQNDKMKAAFCKYFIFSLKFKKKDAPKIEFIFINYEQFNLWYNCLQYIIKINNQTPKIINTKTYNIQCSPNKKKL